MEYCQPLFGVPLETALGPLLFLFHINDVPSDLQGVTRLLADHCRLYASNVYLMAKEVQS